MAVSETINVILSHLIDSVNYYSLEKALGKGRNQKLYFYKYDSVLLDHENFT